MAHRHKQAVVSRLRQPVSVEPPGRSPAAWRLDPTVTFLNHGSYGVTPEVIVRAQDDIRARIDRDPVRFMMVDIERDLDRVREMVAEFVQCDPAGLALTSNATLGVATVLRNIEWQPGDEVLVNDHEYMAGVNELRRLERERGICTISAPIPFPVHDDDELVHAVLARITPRTRLVIVSHVTSPTAIVLPVQRIVDELNARGVDSLVDGAHGPGQVPVDLKTMRPTYYAADLHKWVNSARGSAFVWVRPDRRAGFQPLALSSRVHKERSREPFLCDFDYVGTNDYSALLTVPAAFEHGAGLFPGGWPGLMESNHDLAVLGRRIVGEALGLDSPCPRRMLGSMASLILPDGPASEEEPTYDDPLQDALVEKHAVQVPIWTLQATGQRLLRLSAQAYNTPEDYERLADALRIELT